MTGPMIPVSSIKCPQCNMYHPPLNIDEVCPMLEDPNQIDLSGFMLQLRNICKSQIEGSDLKDPKKLLNHVIIVVTKSIQEYKE